MKRPVWKVRLLGDFDRVTKDVFILTEEPPETLLIETINTENTVIRFERSAVKDGVTEYVMRDAFPALIRTAIAVDMSARINSCGMYDD